MLPQKQNWAAIAAIIDQMVLQAVNTETPSEALVLEAQSQINKIDK